MCLAVPGLVIEVDAAEPEFRSGAVDFSGVRRQVSLAFTPQVQPGQYVLVHAGFALQVIDEEEAAKTLIMLQQLDELETGP